MEVIYDVKVNTADSVKNVEKLGESIEGTTQAFAESDEQAQKYVDQLSELNLKAKSGDASIEELNRVIAEYKAIAISAGEESVVSSYAIEQAAALQGKLKSVHATTKALSEDGQNLEAALQLGEGVTAGYQAFVGVTAILGDENEDLLEVITQVQAAQGVLNSISAIRNTLEKESILMLKLKTAQEKIQIGLTNARTFATNLFTGGLKAQTIATNGAAVAQRVLNLVMNANPIGLLIAGITALVGAFALFNTSAADAKDRQEELTAAIDETNAALERQNAILDAQLADQQKRIDNTNKLIDAEIKYLESIKNRTAQEEATLQKKLGERTANDIKSIELAIETADEKTKGFADSFALQFEAIDAAIEVTDIEDGINNINYDKVRGEVSSFKEKLDEVLNSDIGVEEKIAKLQKLEAQYGKVTKKLNGFNRSLGSAEQEEFANVISGFGEVGKLLTGNTNQLREYNSLVQDEKTRKSLDEIEAATKRQAEAEKRAEKQRALNAKRQAEREKQRAAAEAERQQIAKENIAFAQKTEDLRIELIEDSYEKEFALLDIAFEREMKAIKGNSEEANALREQLFENFISKEDEINERRNKEVAEREKELVQTIAEIRNGLTLDDNEQELQELRSKQEQELEQVRKGLEAGLVTQEEFNELKILQEAEYNERVRQMNEETEKKAQDEAQATHDKKIELFQQYTNQASGLLQGLSNLNDVVTETQLNNAEGNEAKQQEIRKKSFERNKKLQIVQATIQGIQATQAALSSGLAIPVIGPIMGPLFAAGAAGMALANINRIRSTKFDGGGGLGAAASSSGTSSIGAGAADLGTRDLSDIRTDINDDGTVNNDEPQPQRFYVLESDISGTQGKVDQAERRATA